MLQKIKGYVLYACGAQYHRSCRALYIRDPLSCHISDPDALSRQPLMEEAYKQSFEATCAFVEGNIKNTVVKLDFFKDIFVQQLIKTQFPNTQYRSEKLKAKLAVHCGDKLTIQPIQSQSGRFGIHLQ